MARLSPDKLDTLKWAFIELAMSPSQAARSVGIAPATAKRYYDLWDKDIKRGRESMLLPELEASLKRVGKRRGHSGARKR